jgi:hypothetical protein
LKLKYYSGEKYWERIRHPFSGRIVAYYLKIMIATETRTRTEHRLLKKKVISTPLRMNT